MSKPYRVTINASNTKHLTWYRNLPKPDKYNGKPIYEFPTLDDTIRFLMRHIAYVGIDNHFILAGIRDRDGKHSLINTSWYQLTKGDEQMTEYTSL